MIEVYVHGCTSVEYMHVREIRNTKIRIRIQSREIIRKSSKTAAPKTLPEVLPSLLPTNKKIKKRSEETKGNVQGRNRTP